MPPAWAYKSAFYGKYAHETAVIKTVVDISTNIIDGNLLSLSYLRESLIGYSVLEILFLRIVITTDILNTSLKYYILT